MNTSHYLCIIIIKQNKHMTTLEQKPAAYNEAKQECEKYINYKGDKRSISYKVLSHRVVDCWMNRMNSLAKQLELPTYTETFYN